MAIIWDPNILHIEGFFSSQHTLSGGFRILGTTHEGVVTNVYGPKSLDKKLSFLNHLSWLNSRIPYQNWIIGGYLNILTSLTEKKGGIRRLDRDSFALQALIRDLKLADLQTNNGVYTWNNRRGGERQVASRLDKFIILDTLLQNHINLSAAILPMAGSDHWPICLLMDLGRKRSWKTS
jgi:exonuclease III